MDWMKYLPFKMPPIHLPAMHLPAGMHVPAIPASPIGFLSPQFLWLLFALPVAVGIYLLLLRRRKKAAVRYGNFALVKQAMGSGNKWRRHVPPALFLVALALMIIGIARPAARVSLTSEKATVILAMDVSGSMRADDIKPSRIEASQAAAKNYIAQQPKDVRIGIVAFAGTALLVQSPTTDRDSLDAAIDRFDLQRGTAVGSGLLVSLSTLFPQEDFQISPWGLNPGAYDFGYGRFGGTPLGMKPPGGAPKKKPDPVEPGSYKSAVIILLTDGATNAGPDPIDAARQAADHGVRVFTVGFGTPGGGVVGFAGRRMRAELDEESLKKIADMTRGHYYRAGSAADLQAVYKVLSKTLITETKETEITSFFAAAAALFALMSAGLSVLWFSRIL